MESFTIDFEKLDGGMLNGNFIEVQAAMTVRPQAAEDRLEGVHQTSLHLSLDEAGALAVLLAKLLNRAMQAGWKPKNPAAMP